MGKIYVRTARTVLELIIGPVWFKADWSFKDLFIVTTYSVELLFDFSFYFYNACIPMPNKQNIVPIRIGRYTIMPWFSFRNGFRLYQSSETSKKKKGLNIIFFIIHIVKCYVIVFKLFLSNVYKDYSVRNLYGMYVYYL